MSKNRTFNLGFTLIELLIGLSIFAIVAVSLYGVFAGGMQINRYARQQEQLSREIEWAMASLSRDIENMVAYDFSGSYPLRTAVRGQADRLSLVKENRDGLAVVSYYLDELSGVFRRTTHVGGRIKTMATLMTDVRESVPRQALYRRTQDFKEYLSVGITEDGPAETLGIHIKPGSLHFSYAELGGEGMRQLEWISEWRRPHLPYAVRVRLVFVGEGRFAREIPIEREIRIPVYQYAKPIQGK